MSRPHYLTPPRYQLILWSPPRPLAAPPFPSQQGTRLQLGRWHMGSSSPRELEVDARYRKTLSDVSWVVHGGSWLGHS